MKKKLLLLLLIIFFAAFNTFAQYSISFGLPDIDVSTLEAGDDVVIPIKVVKRFPNGPALGSLCIGFDLFFSFDHNFLKWKGTADEPLSGVQNFSPLCPYASADWLFNDTGVVLACLWQDPIFSGEDFPDNEVLFEYVFTYKGGLNSGQSSDLIWTTKQVIVEGRVKEGETNAYTDKLKPYDEVELINGSIFHR